MVFVSVARFTHTDFYGSHLGISCSELGSVGSEYSSRLPYYWRNYSMNPTAINGFVLMMGLLLNTEMAVGRWEKFSVEY